MRDGQEFRRAIRQGAKASAPSLVTHVLPGTGGVTSVGFVVSKAVGGAVERNRVKRRLRHLMRDRLDRVPPGSRVVVRALPAAATRPDLAGDLDQALDRSMRRPGSRSA